MCVWVIVAKLIMLMSIIHVGVMWMGMFTSWEKKEHTLLNIHLTTQGWGSSGLYIPCEKWTIINTSPKGKTLEHFYFLPIKEEIILDKGRRTIEGKHGICQYTNKIRREKQGKRKSNKQREAKTWKLSNPLTESTRDTP